MIIYGVLLMSSAFVSFQAETVKASQSDAASGQRGEEKKICRRYADVGSNIARRKICLNKRQWDKLARDSQEVGRSMQPALTTGAQ